MNQKENRKTKSKSDNKIQSLQKVNDVNSVHERVIVLAIAYHNLAVELEHLKLFDDSLNIY